MHPVTFFAGFFAPWAAEVHSGFSGSTLILLILAGAGIYIVRDFKRLWPLLLFLSFPFLYTFGASSPIYLFFFHYVPGFSSIRVPGRVMYMLFLCVFGTALVISKKFSRKNLTTSAIWTGRLCFGLLLLSFLELFRRPNSPWGGHSLFELTPEKLNPSFWTQNAKAIWIALGLVASLSFSKAFQQKRLAMILLTVTTITQTGMLMHHGTWRVPRANSATQEEFQKANHLPLYGSSPLLAVSGLAEGTWGTATVPYSRFYKAAEDRANCYLPIHQKIETKPVVLPFYLSDRQQCVTTDQEALDQIKNRPCSKQTPLLTFVTQPLCPSTANSNLAQLNQGNHLVYLTPNLVRIAVQTTTPSVLVTPYPAITDNWSALVDGSPHQLTTVNGAFLGIQVPAGQHWIEIKYLSQKIIWSYRIFFITLLLVLGIALRKKWTLLAVLTCLGVVTYGILEKDFVRKAEAKIELNNNYGTLLAEQLLIWKGR